MNTRPKIVISSLDADRLDTLLGSVPDGTFPGKAELEAELARADLRALVQGLRTQLRVAQDNRAGVSLNGLLALVCGLGLLLSRYGLIAAVTGLALVSYLAGSRRSRRVDTPVETDRSDGQLGFWRRDGDDLG